MYDFFDLIFFDGGGDGGADVGAVPLAAVASTATVLGDPPTTAKSRCSCSSTAAVVAVVAVVADAAVDVNAVAVDAGAGDASSGMDWTMVSLRRFRSANRTA